MAEGDEVVETGTEQAEDIETLQQALAEEKEKAERYLANWQRSQADLQNYARRAEQEKSETVEFANRTLILDLLPILDDFERALASLSVELEGQNWTDGIELIYNKLKTVLEAQGLAEIKAKGECFDPYFHEAAGQVDGEEGIIVDELRKGYQFKGKLLRPSMVMVGKAKDNKKLKESSEED
ncbi:MAG: nucleotide exchange factor GrpE [Chloroflexi bacterium RBG_13_50_10]|nr:MAG: nucleotide exchange factor GrpE [Chloroflexi bacterium RBG_13_50_10]